MMKELPIDIPLIIGNLFDAYPLSVASFHSQFENWFYSNSRYASLSIYKEGLYIGPGCLNSYENYIFDQETHPLLNSNLLNRCDVDLNIIDYIKETLNSDKYIYLFIDEFYNPNSEFYKVRPEVHEILVRGYNDSTQEITFSGFDKNYIYNNNLKISYNNLNKSYYSDIFINKKNVSDHQLNIITLQAAQNKIINLNYDSLISTLTNYLNPRIDPYRAEGMDIYKYIAGYSLNAAPVLLLKPFHILYEHKKHINNLMRLFCDTEIASKHEEVILRNSLILRNCLIRNIMSSHNKTIEEILNILDVISTNEPCFIIELKRAIYSINKNLAP